MALGSSAYLFPRLSSALYGLESRHDPARDYMTRLYGARAIILGTGYLLSRGRSRRTWQRLALAVDTLDTIQGAQAGISGKLNPATAAYVSTFTALTAAVGVTKLQADQ